MIRDLVAGLPGRPHRLLPVWVRAVLAKVRSQAVHAPRLAGFCLLAVAATAQAQVVDPFYLRLMRDGSDAFNRQQYEEAARLLRLAVFGMLDDPLVMADGLVRLALAQAASGDPEGFQVSFRRILEIEERFGAYSRATLSADVRRELERQAVRFVPVASLAESQAFAHLVPRPEDALAKLPPRQRRRELEHLIRAEPDRQLWPVMLAELELGERRFRQAMELADGLLQRQGDHVRALRVRGLARAEARQWSGAAEDLGRSELAGSDPEVATALAQALWEERRYEQLLDMYSQLPKEFQELDRIAGLAARARVEMERLRAAGETPSSPRQAEPAAGQSRSGRSAGRRPPASEGVRRELRHIALLRDRGSYDEALASARRLADANPDSSEAQFAAGELAYLLSRWAEAVSYFERGGEPGEGGQAIRFYFAVALFETGQIEAARAMLAPVVGTLARNEFVDRTVQRIMGGS